MSEDFNLSEEEGEGGEGKIENWASASVLRAAKVPKMKVAQKEEHKAQAARVHNLGAAASFYSQLQKTLRMYTI